MKLNSLYINGFGLFQDVRIEGLSPKLTIFFGNNESGKSTLLGFIRAMLFGFPDGRSNENPYPPLNGGRHGGSVEISLDDGQIYVLERYPGVGGGKVGIIKPDRSRGGKDILNRILGIGNRDIYKNIYAFSLTELQSFESLNTESIRESLYSAGAGVDPSGLINLKSGLEKIESDLYKPGGKKPRINRIISRLMEIRKEKKSLTGSIDEYDDLRSRILSISGELKELEGKKIKLSRKIRDSEKWISIRPEWINLSISKIRLSELESIESFPSQGITRLEGLVSRSQDLNNELIQKETELRRKESEISKLRDDPPVMEHASSIRKLQSEQSNFEVVKKDLLSLRQDLAAGELGLKEKIRNLGPLWSEEKIMKFDLSIGTREEVRNYREQLNQSKGKELRIKDSLEEINDRKKEAQKSFQNLDEPAVKDFEKLNRMRRSCGKLKDLISQEQLMIGEKRYISDRLNDLMDEKEILEQGLSNVPPKIPLWPVALVIAGGVLFFFWFGLEDIQSWGIPVSGLFIIVLLGILFLRSKTKKVDLQTRGQLEQRLQKINEKSEDLEAAIGDLDKRIEQVREKINAEGIELSDQESLSIDSLNRVEQEIQDNITELNKWKDAESYLSQANERYEKLLKDFSSSENESAAARESWDDWLILHGMNTGLSPDGVLESLSLIQSSRELIDRLTQLRARIDSHEEVREEYLKLAKHVLESCNRPLKAEDQDSVNVAVHNLISDFSEIELASQKREILLDEIKITRESVNRYKGLITSIEKDIKELMDKGGADNEEMFRERASIFEKRVELTKTMEACEDNIRRLSNNWKNPDRVMGELSTIDLDELENKKNEQERELARTEEKLDLLTREQAKLEEQARRLINDEHTSILRADEERSKEELSLAAEEWATVRLAQHLIRIARTKYEKERQPEVISEAGNFFKRLTGEHYPSLVAPIGENRIEVICKDGSRKELGQLSRGTAEQLYLSLRFGFIQEFSKRSRSLPIIMDEILVNFDPERSKATIDGIIELAKKHQVLFFTCHPETAGLFKDADKSIPVLEISNNEVKELK